ncbi:carbohydrate binding domain-containing protein [Streptomyces sp. NPDC048332]|uniref:carbohydrate binding domain-containing protein n=1 Tax=Streptomyces sp. NPDC048332 TaxID=3154619 RepID=UPI0034325F06
MPSLPPPRTTELFYGDAWHTISGDMREGTPVTISRGATGIGQRSDPTAATATLNNRSGEYSPRNPNSALYGLIGRNTPWRFSLMAGGPRLDLTSSTYTLSTPDSSTLDILGDIDVRIDVAPTTWTSGQMLVSRYAVGGNLAWSLMLTPDGRLLLNWSATGLSGATYARSTIPVPGGRRRQLRATLDVNNGAGGSTVTFYVASGRGGWVQLGDPVVRAGTTSLYNATAPLHIGDPVAIAVTPEGAPLGRLVGSVYGVQVYAGIGGTLRVDVAPEDQAAAGASSFTDATSRVWTLTGGASLSNRHVRMEGEIPAWPPSRDLSGADRTVQIAPAGIMRRLGSGNRPLDSALRRFIIGQGPVECWPLTDGEQATQGASLLGAPAARFVGDVPPLWGRGEVASWLEPTILTTEDASGQIVATLQTPTPTNEWSVDVVRGGATTSEFPSIRDSGRGSDADPHTNWNMLFLSTTSKVQLTRDVYTTDASSTSMLADITLPALFEPRPHHVRLSVEEVGSSTGWTLYVDGASVATGSVAGHGRPLKQVGYAWGFGNTLSLGYITAWGATAPDPADMYQALLGFPGETAAARMLRLSAENGVPATLVGVVDTSTELGVQEPQRYLETLDTIAASDLGMVLEQRDARALIYRPRSTLYNQVPTLSLDFANGEISAPFAPIDDDKLTENDITVTRKGGASANAVRTDGPLSVDAIGRYDVAPEVSLATDGQTVQQAYWRLAVGTFDGLRYTKITVDLGNPRGYALVNDALAVDVGDLIRLQHLPADQQPGDVDLIVTGYEEEVGATAWRITYTCVPGEPWTVGTVEDPTRGKADTAGCQLSAAATAAATTLSVTTTAGPRWITGAPNQVTDPGFEQGTGAWACSRGTTIGVVMWEPTGGRNGTGAARLTRVHPTDTGTLNLQQTGVVYSAATGQTWTVSAWVYSASTVSRDMRVGVVWRNAVGADTFILPAVTSVPSGEWRLLTVSGTLPAGAVSVYPSIVGGTGWAVGEWWRADYVRLARTDNLVGTDNEDQFPFEVTVGGEVVNVHGISGTSNPQTLYVNRSRNGIAKALSAGARLSLTHPMRAPL